MAEEGQVLAASAVVVASAMFALWLLSLRIRNAGIVDVFWGPGFVPVALTAFLLGDGYTPRRVLVLALAAAWGLRLGITGVPILEKHMRRAKPGYEEYARRTSALVPLPPKR